MHFSVSFVVFCYKTKVKCVSSSSSICCHSLQFQYLSTHLTSGPTCQPATPTLLPDSPGISAAAHLQSASIKTPFGSFILCQIVLCLHDKLSNVFTWTDFPASTQVCPDFPASCSSPPFPTTIFACVLPDSWLPVSISATLQEAPAKTLVGFFSLITPSRSPGLFWIIDSLSWFSC